ncbi:hypothetical protein BCR34DRAFT_595026 [Clohesyomyces aquaticus]|uniref:Uncharacterized protein n=1 Tax=Clohesyomyces aquaticus TaxID=1231657 RepID=A0A1Y1Y196_9PLEO|nr:hypothetical protein BCR34DRAFT_595026 [Clohesyomyces aquaticus]
MGTGKSMGRTPQRSLKLRGGDADLKAMSPSPTKKTPRKALGDVTTGTNAGKLNNLVPTKRTGQHPNKTPTSSLEKLKPGRSRGKGLKSPAKVFNIGKHRVLDARPVLRDVFNEAM